MHCDRCAQRLIEIDRYGQQLIGCIEGNCWRGARALLLWNPVPPRLGKPRPASHSHAAFQR
jgi:hypothetical protein